jgi:hypothetical protein
MSLAISKPCAFRVDGNAGRKAVDNRISAPLLRGPEDNRHVAVEIFSHFRSAAMHLSFEERG